MIYYRGTQTPTAARTLRGAVSFTPCLAAATIWAAKPAPALSLGGPRFLSGSTVSAAHIEADPVLWISDLTATPYDLMGMLGWGTPDGIQPEEVRRVYNYMHNRIAGRAPGGSFEYIAYDPDGDVIDEDDMPFSLTWPPPFSPIREARDYWAEEETLEAAANIEADSFVYADAPAVRKVAERLGYRGIAYPDVFEGGVHASGPLFNRPLTSFDCVEEGRDLNGERVVYIETLRPLADSVIDYMWQRPAAEVAAELVR